MEKGGENKTNKERLDKLEKEILKLKKENEKLKKDRKTSITTSNKNDKISRRKFLKKLGAGALGLGALSLTPTTALNIKDDNLNIYTGTSSSNVTEYFSVGQGGPVNILNTNLDLNNNNIKNTQEITTNTLEADDTLTDPSGTNHTGELADSSDLYTDSQASAAAPVQSVNSQTGDVSLTGGGTYWTHSNRV